MTTKATDAVSRNVTKLTCRELADALMPMVRRVARSVAQRLPSHVSVDDLVGAGAVALAELIKRSPDMPLCEFERTAAIKVRYAMLDELRNADPVSRRLRQRARKVAEASQALEARLGRKPSPTEVADHLGLPSASCETAMRVVRSSAAIPMDAEGAPELPFDGISPEERLGQSERALRVRAGVGNLPDRLRTIVDLYYGQELTLREIGGRLGVTEARVSQLLGDAVKRLRQTCVSRPPPPMAA